MIDKLIERTNSKTFFGNGRFHLTELKGQIGHFNTMEFNFIIDEEDNLGNLVNVEHWRIISHQTLKYNGIFTVSYLPYIKLNILSEHPLLWAFTKNTLQCELKGYPKNPSEFIGDLHFEYEKLTGNWIPLNHVFYNLKENFQKNKKMNFSIQEPMKEIIEMVSQKHGIEFKVNKVIEGYNKGYSNRPNAKLLIFGNEKVCPNNFNLRQPYIIADEFIANRK